MKKEDKKPEFLSQNMAVSVCSVIFIICLVLIRVISANKISLNIGKLYLQSGNMCGVISQLLILMLLWMQVSIKNSHSLCTILLTLMCLTTAIPIIISGNLSSIPGLANVLVGGAMLYVINVYMKKIHNNEKVLHDIANTDYLTGLPNRRNLMTYLDELEKNDEEFALAIVDIDNFKKINDTLGHDYGDAVLCRISQIWKNLKPDSDYIARLGGDEFAFIIKNFSDTEELIQRLNMYKKSINKKLMVNNQYVFISASFGAICSSQCDEYKMMLKYADIAMYNSKSSNDKICLFRDEMKSELESDVKIESIIRYALENNGFFLAYQPQFDTATKNLRGFETLIRMRDKNGTTIRPDKFINVAEQSNLIIDIDKWVLRTVLSTFKPLFEKYNSDFLVSVNISVKHIQNADFINNIKKILDETGFRPENLEIEVTESVFISEIDNVIEKLNTIRKMGITIALDDFGTGYASLSNLKNLPVDLLKIDKSFIDDVENGDDERNFVSAIISMGHIMHYSVISEGVENMNQIEILKQLECDHIQGFCWGKPVNTDEAERIIEKHSTDKKHTDN